MPVNQTQKEDALWITISEAKWARTWYLLRKTKLFCLLTEIRKKSYKMAKKGRRGGEV